jgi:hypothetical protein
MTMDSAKDARGQAANAGLADKKLDEVQPSEDAALALLKNGQISSAALAQLARSPIATKSRKVLLMLVEHPRTPRHISVLLLRRMFTFDLVQVTLTPAIPADVKRSAEEQIVLRIESVPMGERISLARRSSGRVAAELLQDFDSHVIAPALDNPRLTEALVVQALMKKDAPAELFRLVSDHGKWSLWREVQIALLRSEKTPINRVQEFARNFSADFMKEIRPEQRV